MATISSYNTAKGRRYRVRYRTPQGRQTDKRGFTTKKAAEAFAATVEVEKMRGEYVPPKLGQIAVGELGLAWLERKEADLKPSAYKSLETAWRIHVEPRWGNARLADIDLDSVERWIADLSRRGKGATVVIRAYGVLAGVLDSAVKARRLAKNPARGVENLPRKQRKPRVYLTHGQVDSLVAAAGPRGTLVYLLAYTGVRWGEAIGLRVKHLDLLRKRLTVVENAVQVNMQMHVGTPKSHTSRSVPIPDFLVVELARQCEGKERDALVFPGRDGEHLRRSVSFTGWFTKAVERAGVPRVTPHDLRHTAASLAVSAGVNVKALQRMLGHASAAMTLDTYAELFDDDLDAVGSALDQARSAAVWAKCGQGETEAT
ncbi:tyrosine-type recombinase/integrase [Rhodococcus jostii]|uniref:tyrosine-type recombinase/integrase n=1 Tax=Rhodococcus jostii TaxID=132919 RepID=UPI00363C4DCF